MDTQPSGDLLSVLPPGDLLRQRAEFATVGGYDERTVRKGIQVGESPQSGSARRGESRWHRFVAAGWPGQGGPGMTLGALRRPVKPLTRAELIKLAETSP